MSHFTNEVSAVPSGDLMMSPVNGFKDGLGVALFVFVLGGFPAIVNKTDALSAGIGALVRKMGGNELKLIHVLMLIFAILGSTYGFCEETIGFYALLSATMMAAGFDALTGAMMVLLGAGGGCLGSTVNPFATGIAADVLASSGIVADQGVVIGLGLVLLVTPYLVSVYFVMRYAKGVKADRSRTLMSADEVAASGEAYGDAAAAGNQYEPLSHKQKVVLWLFGLSFLVMIVGLSRGVAILIPGTSSMATISMPIMGPLTQPLGFNPAIIINVFASASGVVNYFTPANGAIMGGLALSRVEYGTWLKFVGKVVLVTAIVNVAVLAVAMVVL